MKMDSGFTRKSSV